MREKRTKRVTDKAVGTAAFRFAGNVVPMASVERSQENALDPQALIDEFTGSLGQFGLDRDQQALLAGEFEAAARQAAAGEQAEGHDLKRSDWLEAVEILRQSGAVDEDEGNALVRKLDDAMLPLQKPNVRLAMEFSRRYQEEGADEALSWFKAQKAAAGSAAIAPDTSPARVDAPVNAAQITQSRSRRLRGPPKA